MNRSLSMIAPVTDQDKADRSAIALVSVLKQVVGAEKVYMHTMCSGPLSHLHFQLIPRLPGEQIGGRVFAAERGVLIDYKDILQALKAEVHKLLL